MQLCRLCSDGVGLFRDLEGAKGRVSAPDCSWVHHRAPGHCRGKAARCQNDQCDPPQGAGPRVTGHWVCAAASLPAALCRSPAFGLAAGLVATMLTLLLALRAILQQFGDVLDVSWLCKIQCGLPRMQG